MDKLLEWLKANVKDGADMNEATALLEGVTEVTPERAAELAKDKEVRRIIDAEISRAVERHDERFREEKLPKLIEEERGKIRAELNPEETAEQKRIRELEERIAKADRDRETVERRETLRKRAAELGINEIGLTPDDIEPFVSLGDTAGDTLESFINRSKEAWTASLDAKLKEQYKGKAPEGSPETGEDDGPHGDDYVRARLKDSFLG
jgi:hypothetical protein